MRATVGGLFRTPGRDFATEAVATLELGFEGIAGDRHGGATRRTGGREPWYPRGTTIRNERQLSILCRDELAFVAEALGVPVVEPEWIGGNLVLAGVPRLSRLPPRTLLMFANGVSLRVDGDNAPCRASGRAVARRYPESDNLEFGFVRAARGLRGLVAFVEKPGTLGVGEHVELRLPEQWIYD